MESTNQNDFPLAPFRKDLEIFPGPDEPDGTPTYVLFDPIKGQYFKIGTLQVTLMRLLKPGMTFSRLLQEINFSSSFKISEEELKQVFMQAMHQNLLEIPKSSETVTEAYEKSKTSFWYWLLMHYLYIRIPLTNPDQFLDKTLPFVAPLFSKAALFLYSLCIIMGLLIVGLHFEQYIHTFTYFFTLEGVLGYIAAIACVKMLHELGHAYTAKYYKIHVPTMGLAFLVLFPVLYTNVTNAWRLKERAHRFAITIAGVAVELTLAGLATLGWAMTGPGILNSVFFLISSTTWVTSLLLNLNPAMRFDGYYLMTDILGVDNLQQRAFALTRWRLREWFFDLNIPPPEEGVSQKRLNLLTLYSIYTWIYRIVLYTAIALFVYYEFTKALGIILFIVEVAVFIVAPFLSEIKQLALRKQYFNLNPRAVISFTLFALFLLWFLLPLPHQKQFAGITQPLLHQELYVQEPGAVQQIFAKRGDQVQKGAKILTLHSDLLALKIKEAQAETALLEQELLVLEQNEEGRAFLNPKKAELKRKESELASLKTRAERLTLDAEISGTLYEFSELIRIGLYLAQGTLVGKIGDLSQTQVLAFIPESESQGIQTGTRVAFKLLNPIERIEGTIQTIYKNPTPFLKYPALASLYRGPIPVVREKEGFKLLDNYYLAEIALDSPLPFGQTGTVEVEGPFESRLGSLMRRAIKLMQKESGF